MFDQMGNDSDIVNDCPARTTIKVIVEQPQVLGRVSGQTTVQGFRLQLATGKRDPVHQFGFGDPFFVHSKSFKKKCASTY